MGNWNIRQTDCPDKEQFLARQKTESIVIEVILTTMGRITFLEACVGGSVQFQLNWTLCVDSHDKTREAEWRREWGLDQANKGLTGGQIVHPG